MSAERMVTEREAVERERKAFVAGQRDEWFYLRNQNCLTSNAVVRMDGCRSREKQAEASYPLPKVRRLREVKGPDCDGNGDASIRYNPALGRWEQRWLTGLYAGLWAEWNGSVGPKNLMAVADLKANPWEEVDG